MYLLHSPWRARARAPVFIRSCITSVCLLFSLSVYAEEFEQHHAHEHGKVTLNIAIDGHALILELAAPAANVVGFEHAPRTASEQAAVSSAGAWMRAGKDILATPAAAECHYTSIELKAPQWEADEDHDHDHDHGGSDHEAGAHEHHADYEAHFSYQCAHPEKLTWLEPRLLDKLLNIIEARVNVLAPKGQRSETVKSARSRIVIG
jgi:hypothetical protein